MTASKACSDDISLVHKMLYGFAPTDEQVGELLHLGVSSNQTADLAPKERYATIARHMIAMRQRSQYPTAFNVKMRPDEIHYHPVFDDLLLAVDLADHSVGMPIASWIEYDPALSNFFRRSLNNGMCAIDIGANIGYFTLLAARLCGPSGKVIAFEPNQNNVHLMIASLCKNQIDNVSIVPIALGDRLSYAYFSAALGSNGGLTSPELVRFCDIVPIVSLDAILSEKVDFLKIDVEGAEGLVFAGAKKTLEACRPIICSEFSPLMLLSNSKMGDPFDLLRLLLSMGYDCCELQDDGHEKAIVSPENFASGFEGANLHRIVNLTFHPHERL